MKRNFVRRTCLAIGVLPFLLTACQIFPEEEEIAPAPVIQSYQVQEYTQTPVMRGDMELVEMVNCQYVPMKKELLGFVLGGEYIDQIFVTEGQQVKAGDLLAQLVLEDMDQQVAQQEYELKVLNLKKAHLQEDWTLTAAQYDIRNDLEGKIEAEASYRNQLQDMEDSIYIQKLKLQDIKEELQQRQIYAGIDGVVTYVKHTEDGARSVEGANLIIISDMSTTAFTVKGEDAAYFPVGTEVVIVYKDKEYKATSVAVAELGLSEEETEEETAYLQMEQPDPTLEDGDRGKIYVTLDFREDVLYVHKKAVRSADNKRFVYMLNEEGLRVMQDVTIGLESGDYIEIISGLEAGDSVIIE